MVPKTLLCALCTTLAHELFGLPYGSVERECNSNTRLHAKQQAVQRHCVASGRWARCSTSRGNRCSTTCARRSSAGAWSPELSRQCNSCLMQSAVARLCYVPDTSEPAGTCWHLLAGTSITRDMCTAAHRATLNARTRGTLLARLCIRKQWQRRTTKWLTAHWLASSAFVQPSMSFVCVSQSSKSCPKPCRRVNVFACLAAPPLANKLNSQRSL